MSSVIEIENLHTTFRSLSKHVHAVRGVTFSLKEGEVLGIVGESGSGKSALAKTLMGLLPPDTASIDQGSVLYRGEDILLKSEKEMQKIRGKEIGMIFQDPMTSLNPTMKVGAQIVEGYLLHHRKAGRSEAYAKAVDILKRVGIPYPEATLQQYPHELSGGMRQRIMIAIATISRAKVLIADEPTTALDVTIQAQILDLLREIQKKEQMSIVLITHDLSVVANFCDRVLVMYAGEVVEDAPVGTLFKAPKHPYTRRLIYSIPRLDLPSQKMLYSIDGSPPDLSQTFSGCPFAERCPHAHSVCYHRAPVSAEVGEKHTVKCWLHGGKAHG